MSKFLLNVYDKNNFFLKNKNTIYIQFIAIYFVRKTQIIYDFLTGGISKIDCNLLFVFPVPLTYRELCVILTK
jgi:hypothetical protein